MRKSRLGHSKGPACLWTTSQEGPRKARLGALSSASHNPPSLQQAVSLAFRNKVSFRDIAKQRQPQVPPPRSDRAIYRSPAPVALHMCKLVQKSGVFQGGSQHPHPGREARQQVGAQGALAPGSGPAHTSMMRLTPQ